MIKANGRIVNLVTYAETGDEWEPVAATATLVPVRAISSKFKINEVKDPLIQSTDMLLISDASQAPSVGMQLRDSDGIEYSIVSVEPVKPGETVIMYKTYVRI
jgi:hypothetical protein